MYTHQCPKILKGANRNMTKKEKEKPNFIQTSCDDADEYDQLESSNHPLRRLPISKMRKSNESSSNIITFAGDDCSAGKVIDPQIEVN